MKVKQLFSRLWNQKAFVVSFIVALLLWQMNKLSKQYTTDIVIPIELTSDYDSNKWVENGELDIQANCQSDGHSLVYYKFGIAPRISIPVSKVSIIHRDSYEYSIDLKSLAREIQNHSKNININYLLDTSYTVSLADISTKKVPVRSQVSVTYAVQHMNPNGRVQFTADSISVSGPEIILDTLSYILTKKVSHKRLDHTVKSSVGLIIPKPLYSSTRNIQYSIEVRRFTQYKFSSSVLVKGASGKIKKGMHNDMTIIPADVTIFANMPFDTRTDEDGIHTYIEYDPENPSNQYEVKVEGMPPGSEVISIYPKFVRVFREN